MKSIPVRWVSESINQRLHCGDISLHLSEVKDPVMDVLDKTDLIKHLSGKVFCPIILASQKYRRKVRKIIRQV
jgi:SulP family sulfate permease